MIRPYSVLQRTLSELKNRWRGKAPYNWICSQFKSLRQDLTVRRTLFASFEASALHHPALLRSSASRTNSQYWFTRFMLAWHWKAYAGVAMRAPIFTHIIPGRYGRVQPMPSDIERAV